MNLLWARAGVASAGHSNQPNGDEENAPRFPSMRDENLYIEEQREWPVSHWDIHRLIEPLGAAHLKQGHLLGSMARLGFDLKLEVQLATLTEAVIKSAEIEGEVLDRAAVRSSLARRLGLPDAAVSPPDSRMEGVVEIMLDATQNYSAL